MIKEARRTWQKCERLLLRNKAETDGQELCQGRDVEGGQDGGTDAIYL